MLADTTCQHTIVPGASSSRKWEKKEGAGLEVGNILDVDNVDPESGAIAGSLHNLLGHEPMAGSP